MRSQARQRRAWSSGAEEKERLSLSSALIRSLVRLPSTEDLEGSVIWSSHAASDELEHIKGHMNLYYNRLLLTPKALSVIFFLGEK